MKKIVIIGSLAESLINFRRELIQALTHSGWQVVAVAPMPESITVADIEALGCQFVPVALSRNGMNPLSDIAYYRQLKAILQQHQPDKVLAYTIKPIMWGGLACRAVLKQAGFYPLVEGAGFLFRGQGLLPIILEPVIKTLLRVALRPAPATIFLNEDDQQLYLKKKLIASKQVQRIMGIGVDLKHFQVSAVPEQPARFLLVGRLLKEKGHQEFYQAAKIVKQRHPEVRFEILGQLDGGKNAITQAELEQWQREGVIDYLQTTQDVRPVLKTCSVFVLPSYYGEGLPRSTMEAMATGRPIITTDNVGCRDTVKHGVNGLLIEKQSSAALAEAMLWMLDNQQAWQTMGDASRQMAEQLFDVNKINQQLLEVMGA